MGLDQTIEVVNRTTGDVVESFYFRKFNALQGFMEREFFNLENCVKTEIPWELVGELNHITDLILENRNIASELLPTQDGFFFGSLEYDEYYYDNVTELFELTGRIYDDYDGTQYLVTYWSWW